MKTYYTDKNKIRIRVRSIRISLISTMHPRFVAWLQTRLPDVDVDVNKGTGDYVNEIPARWGSGAREMIMEYWNEFCEASPELFIDPTEVSEY